MDLFFNGTHSFMKISEFCNLTYFDPQQLRLQFNFTGTRHVRRAKLNILCLEIIDLFFYVVKISNVLYWFGQSTIKIVDVFAALIPLISKLSSVEMIYVILSRA